MDYIIRFDAKLPEPIALALAQRAKDTGESPAEIASRAIAFYLAVDSLQERESLERIYQDESGEGVA